MWLSASVGPISIVSVKKCLHINYCEFHCFYRVYLLSSIFQFVLWCKGVPYKTVLGSVLFLWFYKPIIWVNSVASQQYHTDPPTDYYFSALNMLLRLLLPSLPCMLTWSRLMKRRAVNNSQTHADTCLHVKVLLRLLGDF